MEVGRVLGLVFDNSKSCYFSNFFSFSIILTLTCKGCWADWDRMQYLKNITPNNTFRCCTKVQDILKKYIKKCKKVFFFY